MLIRVKRKLRNPDAPQRHDNHRRPMTRRELIAQGFMTGGAAVLSTGLFSLFANPRTALAQLAEDLALDASALGCGIDCDGGAIGVRLKNADSVLVDIPNGARVSSMTEFEDPDAEEGELPQGAKFGPDDKLFRLDRTDARDCLPIVYDEEIKRQIGAAQ